MAFCNIKDVLTYLPHWLEIREDTSPSVSQVQARIDGIAAKIRNIIGDLRYNPDDVYLRDLNAKGAAGWVLATAEMKTENEIKYVNRLLNEYEKELEDFKNNTEFYLQAGLEGFAILSKGVNSCNETEPYFRMRDVF